MEDRFLLWLILTREPKQIIINYGYFNVMRIYSKYHNIIVSGKKEYQVNELVEKLYNISEKDFMDESTNKIRESKTTSEFKDYIKNLFLNMSEKKLALFEAYKELGGDGKF